MFIFGLSIVDFVEMLLRVLQYIQVLQYTVYAFEGFTIYTGFTIYMLWAFYNIYRFYNIYAYESFTIYRGSAWLHDMSVLPSFWDFQNLQIYRNSKMIVLCYNTEACISSNGRTIVAQNHPFLYYSKYYIL